MPSLDNGATEASGMPRRIKTALVLAVAGCWSATAVMGAVIVDREGSTEGISADADASSIVLRAVAALAVAVVLLVSVLKFATADGGEPEVDATAERIRDDAMHQGTANSVQQCFDIQMLIQHTDHDQINPLFDGADAVEDAAPAASVAIEKMASPPSEQGGARSAAGSRRQRRLRGARPSRLRHP